MAPSKTVSVRQALQFVADNPVMLDDDMLQKPVFELVARSLYDIANSPNPQVRGATSRANKARKLILDRLVGKRKPGTRPATKVKAELNFVDLTGGEIPA